MCKKCGNNGCNGCGSSSEAVSALEATVANLAEQLAELQDNAKFLIDGHPILLIEQVDDIGLFDLTSGLGAGIWEGWAVCDGQVHQNKKKKNITTPNFTDRFIVQAGGTYAVDDTGGEATHVLITTELPIHSHGIADPGHSHSVVDPGHDHPVTDPGHSHGGTGGSHTHTFTTSSNGDHTHLVPELVDQISNSGLGATAGNDPVTNGNSGTAGAHTHSGTTDAAAAGITVSSAFTGVDVTDSFTGISVQSAATGIAGTDPEGADAPHNNLPPYWAALYIMKL